MMNTQKIHASILQADDKQEALASILIIGDD